MREARGRSVQAITWGKRRMRFIEPRINRLFMSEMFCKQAHCLRQSCVFTYGRARKFDTVVRRVRLGICALRYRVIAGLFASHTFKLLIVQFYHEYTRDSGSTL